MWQEIGILHSKFGGQTLVSKHGRSLEGAEGAGNEKRERRLLIWCRLFEDLIASDLKCSDSVLCKSLFAIFVKRYFWFGLQLQAINKKFRSLDRSKKKKKSPDRNRYAPWANTQHVQSGAKWHSACSSKCRSVELDAHFHVCGGKDVNSLPWAYIGEDRIIYIKLKSN
jgi:hypothetical protein